MAIKTQNLILFSSLGIGVLLIILSRTKTSTSEQTLPPPSPPTKDCPRGGWYIREEGKACDPNYVPSDNKCVCLFQ